MSCFVYAGYICVSTEFAKVEWVLVITDDTTPHSMTTTFSQTVKSKKSKWKQ